MENKINWHNLYRYPLFIIIFPFMLVLGYIMRALTHPSERS